MKTKGPYFPQRQYSSWSNGPGSVQSQRLPSVARSTDQRPNQSRFHTHRPNTFSRLFFFFYFKDKARYYLCTSKALCNQSQKINYLDVDKFLNQPFITRSARTCTRKHDYVSSFSFFRVARSLATVKSCYCAQGNMFFFSMLQQLSTVCSFFW